MVECTRRAARAPADEPCLTRPWPALPGPATLPTWRLIACPVPACARLQGDFDELKGYEEECAAPEPLLADILGDVA